LFFLGIVSPSSLFPFLPCCRFVRSFFNPTPMASAYKDSRQNLPFWFSSFALPSLPPFPTLFCVVLQQGHPLGPWMTPSVALRQASYKHHVRATAISPTLFPPKLSSFFPFLVIPFFPLVSFAGPPFSLSRTLFDGLPPLLPRVGVGCRCNAVSSDLDTFVFSPSLSHDRGRRCSPYVF